MKNSLTEKSSMDEIRARFDADVERFSNLETGQAAPLAAPLSMELITQAAVSATPNIERVLDIGCGAGNNSLRLAQVYAGDFDCDLCDVSRPMLERAEQRLSKEVNYDIRLFEGDIRNIEFDDSGYDVVLAAAVLHHLRDDADWEHVFQKIYTLLRPGGSFWVTDLVTQESQALDTLMWKRYGDYLEDLGGEAYRKEVFTYIEKEDSPRPLTYQLDLMRRVGFQSVDVLHKNSCFAAFGAIKGT
jgi:tRNA (cmo5U34)-methyltransferase